MIRRRKGFTFVELLLGVGLMAFIILGVLSLLITSLRSIERTTTDINLSQPNAQAVRRVSESIRQAMEVTISNSGNTISYRLPKMNATNDPATGEKELQIPLEWDGVNRSFSITNGNLVEMPGNRVLLRNISAVDPQPGSTQFNQSYSKFQLSNLGSQRAITINLITSRDVQGKTRYSRMRTTVVIQNLK
jgi:type II secretory pathway pseudopilin PulG